MQLAQFVLMIMVALLAGSSSFASAGKCGLKTTNNVVLVVPLTETALGKPAAPSDSSLEERGGGGGTVGAAGRAIGGNAVPLNGPVADPNTGVVVVTTFSNNGLWERIGRWWKGLFHASRRLRSVQDV
ncbi:hypothetical protein PF005_g17958 [Phytophthora fragariae]|uniref:RxLR effector protein n=2 Tax=Phytophthora TaxID=4783 RepID=A0A6A3XN09_9STRA|nr:hypothetical protein PF003_g32998 [Phytophthora fragariae]KAE9010790.1 hypothetical protein PR002_g15263 [Phytophthora rubi]KAE8928861.1 hypothetical protein PF009_g21014 [Phytophthora fragariae]KAE8997769.1 hypothetical protein PF011_g15337 [Phytophthora fragariae]KAE9013263.1 hypothetical protein PR001_g15455 [Phytophthora rubi]